MNILGVFGTTQKKKGPPDIFYVRSLKRVQREVKRAPPIVKLAQERLKDLGAVVKNIPPENEEKYADAQFDELKQNPNKYVEPFLKLFDLPKPVLVDVAIDTLHVSTL